VLKQHFFKIIFIHLILLLPIISSIAEARGRLEGIDSSSKYLIYYGGDFSQENLSNMKKFDVVVLNPNNQNVTPQIVKELQDAGVSYVIGYISIGEDVAAPDEQAILHQGKGPVYVDENNLELVHQNSGVASFYLDSSYNKELDIYEHDGIADRNGVFGGYYIYPNSDWRWIINEMRIGGSQNFKQRKHTAGLKQIAGKRDPANLDNRFANYGFDGFFLDTIDTAGPYKATGWYPWVAKAMQETIKFISDTYPDKIVLANRGGFYFHAGLYNNTYNIHPIDYNIRPYINAMLFESYMLDSDASHTDVSPYFFDNAHNVAPKIMTEANRSDGFTITSMDYMMGREASLYDQLFSATVKENGWLGYLTSAEGIKTVDLNFLNKLSDKNLILDTSPPEWMNTGNQYNENRPARIGIQKLKAGENPRELTIFWDSAKDQSWPVKYNISVATTPDFSDKVVYKNVAFEKNPQWEQDPLNHVANQFTLKNLPDATYYVRVTAEDSSASHLEDDNQVTLSIEVNYATSNPIQNEFSIDGNVEEWDHLLSFGEDEKDMPNASMLDWQKAWMANTPDTLFLAYQYHNPLQMSWGHIVHLDTDTNKNTGFKGSSGEYPIGVDYMIQGYDIWKYTGDGQSWSWQFVAEATRSWTTFNSEMKLPLNLIGNPEKINLFYEADNIAIGHAGTDLFPNDAISGKQYFSYSLNTPPLLIN